MALDIGRELKMAIKTGKVLIGYSETKKALEKNKVKLVIMAKNAPEVMKAEVEKHKNVPCYTYDGTNLELGTVCGKPYPTSVLGIIDPGDSNVLKVAND